MTRHKIKAILLAGAAIFLVSACGQSSQIEETSVKLVKDGTVVNTIVEEFDETLYSKDSLQSMVLNEVAAFNSSEEELNISVDKLETADGKVTVVMTYSNTEAYAEFNEKTFYSGTVSEAYEAGVNLDVTLHSTGKDGGQITKEEILKMGGYRIVIVEEPIKVITDSQILYTSSNVEVLSGKAARVTDKTEENAYLIMK